ncbi:MAG: ABC transporter permease [Roseburia sp.]|nr:ABC transporter permease [Roseburia sp.]MCM1243525.1 ABC transporter permease [Roseburia sp.]
MNTKIIWTLMKKEILDVFRDKKTVLMMLVVPLILYPLIFIGAMSVVSFIASNMEEQNYRIAVEAEDDGAFVHKLMEKSEEHADAEEGEASYTLTVYDVYSMDSIHDYMAELGEETIDAYIVGQEQEGKMQYDVYYLSSASNSAYAMNIVMDVFDEFREELTKELIQEAGLDVHEIMEPVTYQTMDTASNEQSLGSIMGAILPFMLIVSLLLGTMYPAIDTTAGERERGTLETILTLPVTNRQLIVSKFLTVASIGILSALLNILSMGGLAFYMFQILELSSDTQAFDISQFVPAILVCILAIFAFSLFISAITMCVTSFAKSYKEANNYITPLMLVVMITGYIGFIPNIELTQTMAMIPVANICLLIKNLLVFKVDYAAIAVVLLSNVAYAVLAVLVLSRIYDSEAVLFGDAKSGIQIFEKRSNLKKGGVPAMSDVALVIAVTIVLMLYVGSLLQVRFGLAGLFGTQMLLLLVPLFVVLYTKKDILLTYGFAGTGVKSYIGSAVMAFGMVCLNLVISTGMVNLFPNSADSVTTTFEGLTTGGVGSAFLVIAVTPAICEEMLFRGMIFHSMKARYRITTSIVTVAVLFGLYHMSLVKFIPTGFLGLMFCYVVYKTGSIFPAMLMHFINNAVSVLLMYYPEQIGRVMPVLVKETVSVSDILLLSGAGLILVGIGLMVLKVRKEKQETA